MFLHYKKILLPIWWMCSVLRRLVPGLSFDGFALTRTQNLASGCVPTWHLQYYDPKLLLWWKSFILFIWNEYAIPYSWPQAFLCLWCQKSARQRNWGWLVFVIWKVRWGLFCNTNYHMKKQEWGCHRCNNPGIITQVIDLSHRSRLLWHTVTAF